MKISPMPLVRVVLPFFVFPVVPGLLPAQTQGKAHPAALASQRSTNPTRNCNNPILAMGKVTFLSGPSPSSPGYGSKPEMLLNKLRREVKIEQFKGPICPLSLQKPAPPLPFQVIATPSRKITQSGKPIPKGNYPTAHWPTGPYRTYLIHYSIAPKDLKLYSSYKWQRTIGASGNGGGFSIGPPDIIGPGAIITVGPSYFGSLEFATVLYGNNGSIVNSTDTFVPVGATPSEAKKMLQSGVGLDQTIAVPASGTYRLRAVVTDPASKRGSESELTLDAANPKLVETAPVRPSPASK